MEEPEAQSRGGGGGGGRVRKKSQKLLEMEDFASAWKEQSTTAGTGKAASPKKKCPTKMQLEATMRLPNGKGTAVVSATSDAIVTAVADGSPKEDKERVSFAEKERLRKNDRDEYPDWKSDDGNIDGTPANPKIPNHAASKTSVSNPSKSLVVTKTSSVHFSRTVCAGEVGSVEIAPKSEKNGSSMKAQIGSKRPADRVTGANGGETTPKKILKAASPLNGPVTPFKNILPKGKPSLPSSPSHPTSASRAPPQTPPPPSRAPPPTPSSVAKSKQNNFEEELSKADLALRKQKLAKKIKVTNDKSTASATSQKIESLPTIIPSTSLSSATSASLTSSDILERSGVTGKKSVSFEAEKSPKSEKPKKEKNKKSGEELDHPTRDQQSHQSEKPVKSPKAYREPPYKPDADTEGYILFCKTARRKVKKDFPAISFSDITRVAVERWNALSPREKLIWSRKATKNSQSSAPKGKASSVPSNSSPSRIMKMGNGSSASPNNAKRMGKQPQQQQQQRGSNSKQLKSIQQLQRIQQQNQRLKQKEQLQMSNQVELKPNVDARTSSDSVSISQPLPPAQPPPPPKLDPTTFVPPSDLDYSSLGYVRDVLAVGSSSSTSSASSLPSTLDSAANLKLLGESLTVIGTRLTATTTPLAVQGGLSVLMDSLLCATAPLTALLTSEVPEIEDEETRKMQAQILENAAYIMPGM